MDDRPVAPTGAWSTRSPTVFRRDGHPVREPGDHATFTPPSNGGTSYCSTSAGSFKGEKASSGDARGVRPLWREGMENLMVQLFDNPEYVPGWPLVTVTAWALDSDRAGSTWLVVGTHRRQALTAYFARKVQGIHQTYNLELDEKAF